MGIKRFFDPIPGACREVPTTRGVVTSEADPQGFAEVEWMGKTVSARVLGKAVSAGDSVTVVIVGKDTFAMSTEGKYVSSEPRKLSSLGNKKKASQAIRMLLDKNPRSRLYMRALVESFDSSNNTAECKTADGRTSTMPVLWDGEAASSAAGRIGLVSYIRRNSLGMALQPHLIGDIADTPANGDVLLVMSPVFNWFLNFWVYQFFPYMIDLPMNRVDIGVSGYVGQIELLAYDGQSVYSGTPYSVTTPTSASVTINGTTETIAATVTPYDLGTGFWQNPYYDDVYCSVSGSNGTYHIDSSTEHTVTFKKLTFEIGRTVDGTISLAGPLLMLFGSATSAIGCDLPVGYHNNNARSEWVPPVNITNERS
jgi:hypothetical protein